MRHSRLAAAVVLVLAAAPAAARADAPWSPPAAVRGSGSPDAQLVATGAGHVLLRTVDAAARNGQGTLLTPIGPDGRPGTGRRVRMSSVALVAFGKDHVLLAGTTPAATGAQADMAKVLVASGTPTGGVGSPHALPGTTRHQVFAAAGGPDGTQAVVTGTFGRRPVRVVWVGRGGTFRRALSFRVGEHARDAAVAVGDKGDVLVVYENNHAILSRHLGPTGRAAPAHRLGSGVQSHLEARLDPSGRQEVAWASQRLNEGDAAEAVIFHTSAARGGEFARARVVGRSNETGPGRALPRPAVRLVGTGSDSSVLAMTVHEGVNYRTQVADVVAGTVARPQLVTPAGEDDALGDLAYGRALGTLVLYRTGTRGDDASGPQRVVARVRPTGARAFGPPEGVSPAPNPPFGEPSVTIASAPGAAVDPVTGAAFAAFGSLDAGVAVSARPVH